MQMRGLGPLARLCISMDVPNEVTSGASNPCVRLGLPLICNWVGEREGRERGGQKTCLGERVFHICNVANMDQGDGPVDIMGGLSRPVTICQPIHIPKLEREFDDAKIGGSWCIMHQELPREGVYATGAGNG